MTHIPCREENSVVTRPHKILLIDNDPIHSAAVARVFASESDLTLRIVDSLQKCKDLVAAPAAQWPDLAIMDLYLADGQACEVLTNPWGKGPFPVLVMVDPAREEGGIVAIQAGAIDYVVKSTLGIAALPHKARRILHKLEIIRAQELATAALLDQETELAAIYENAPLIMMLIDSAHKVRKLNHLPVSRAGINVSALEGLLGGEALGCIHAVGSGKNCGEGPMCKSCVACRTVINTLQTGCSHALVECLIPMTIEGREQSRPFLLSTARIFLHGETMALVSLLDISQLKQAEEQVQHALRMETIGTLAGGIAHDFNNILTPILGFATLAQDDMAPESRAMKDLQHIVEAGKRAKALVRQLLTFSRQHEEECQPLQASLLIKEILKLLRSAIPATIDIKKNITAQEQTIFIDPTKLHQVVMNLCTNASQAMRETGGTLTVALDPIIFQEGDLFGQEKVAGEYLRLTVSDTGSGMEPTTMSRIFEPYFTTKSREKGTGLGLAVVHGIVTNSHGFITVQSTLGQGSCFQVIWPIYHPESSPEQCGGPAVMPLSKGNELILLVDDEPAVLGTSERELHSLGYQVESRTDPQAALALFQQTPGAFALVLTDYAMPKMNGLTLAQRLVAIHPQVKIVMSTGFADVLTPEEMTGVGIKKLLLKPVLRHDLAVAIRSTLDE